MQPAGMSAAPAPGRLLRRGCPLSAVVLMQPLTVPRWDPPKKGWFQPRSLPGPGSQCGPPKSCNGTTGGVEQAEGTAGRDSEEEHACW